jgi:hypothetical protein
VPDKVSAAAAVAVAVARLADQLGVGPDEPRSYRRRVKTRTEHLRLVAQYLGWRLPMTMELEELDEFLLARALGHDSPSKAERTMRDGPAERGKAGEAGRRCWTTWWPSSPTGDH